MSNKNVAQQALVRALVLSLLLLAGAGLCRAQAPSPQGTDSQAQTADKASPQTAPPATDSDWHLIVAPYLWFPGVHGTIGGASRDTSVHASAGDLLSHFRFGLMGEADLRYKRLLLPLDMMWVRLGDNKALPFPNVGASSVDVKATEFILTPKIGYRVVDQKMFKIDALTGFRYWHLGTNLQFQPSNLNFSGSQNWVDPLVGGRILTALSPKVEVLIGGDVGGWGAGSQLDYQVVGILGYRIKPKWALLAGYRYLDVDYRSAGFIFDTASSGVVFGVSINLK